MEKQFLTRGEAIDLAQKYGFVIRDGSKVRLTKEYEDLLEKVLVRQPLPKQPGDISHRLAESIGIYCNVGKDTDLPSLDDLVHILIVVSDFIEHEKLRELMESMK